jgi:hypothetical protein
MSSRSLPRPAAFGVLAIVLTAFALSVPPAGAAEERKMEIAFEHDGDPVYKVLPPGRIPAIDDPRFVRGDEADAQMAPEEAVFGLIVGDDARAYSLWQLDRHEIVNDEIGGVALAATW